MNDSLKIRELKTTVEFLLKGFNTEGLTATQRKLLKAAELVESLPNSLGINLGYKHGVKDVLLKEFKEAADINQKVQILVLGLCDVLKSIEISLNELK